MRPRGLYPAISIVTVIMLIILEKATAYPVLPVRYLYSLEQGFLQPSDVAVARHRIYVADGVNHCIKVFDEHGSFLTSIGGKGDAPGKLNSPLGIALGTDGTLYVADSGNRRIQIFTASGKHEQTILLPKTPEMRPPDPVDVALDEKDQRLYIVDNDNHRISIYSLLQKRFTAAWGTEGEVRGAYNHPFFIAVGKDRSVFIVDVLNTRVQVMSPQGEPVAIIGGWGVDVGRMYRPKGVCVDRDNRIFVSDSYLGVVQVFNRYGHLLAVVGDENGAVLKLTTPVGMAIDDAQRLYVVEMVRNRVSVFQVLPEMMEKNE
ncbi:MAG: NHL repeat-containing protein [Desulfobacterota bacterium]|nr:NHL repeat-containing protein [Thermodesulfobacteriota bacterium]